MYIPGPGIRQLYLEPHYWGVKIWVPFFYNVQGWLQLFMKKIGHGNCSVPLFYA